MDENCANNLAKALYRWENKELVDAIERYTDGLVFTTQMREVINRDTEHSQSIKERRKRKQLCSVEKASGIIKIINEEFAKINYGKLEINMSDLTSMKNIGKEMGKRLISVGIESSEKLIEVGAKDTFLRQMQKYPNVCLVHLYTLEGVIHDTEFNGLSEDTKKELKEFSDF